MIDQYIKPYHLLVSPPFDVLVGISYGPPLTDPFKFSNESNRLDLFSTFYVKTLLKTITHPYLNSLFAVSLAKCLIFNH